MTAPIPPAAITGLILAGGRGSRMGGVDKGLQPFEGQALVLHALQRLAPQVQHLAVNANRHLDRYAALGVPVWPDDRPLGLPDFPGPLAGFLAGLSRCETPYLVTVPCDSPRLPLDLVERLADRLSRAGAEVAVATTLAAEGGPTERQPVFCLMHRRVLDGLRRFLQGGQRSVDRWIGAQHSVEVCFDDADAFFNANTLQDLGADAPPPAPGAAPTTGG